MVSGGGLAGGRRVTDWRSGNECQYKHVTMVAGGGLGLETDYLGLEV